MGFLSAAAGVGALSGALFLASRASVLGLGKWIGLAQGLMGLGLIAFAWATQVWQALAVLLVVGFGMMVQMASSNTILQTIVDEDKRGRVMSLYTMAFLGVMPLGSLLAGTLADHVGVMLTLQLAGLAGLIAALVFALRLPSLRLQVRPIYVRLGIMPEIAEGLGKAAEMVSPQQE